MKRYTTLIIVLALCGCNTGGGGGSGDGYRLPTAYRGKYCLLSAANQMIGAPQYRFTHIGHIRNNFDFLSV